MKLPIGSIVTAAQENKTKITKVPPRQEEEKPREDRAQR